MMLVLRATPASGGAVEERRLEQGSLTLGRNADNDWVLSDPDRILSKLHCRIDSSDGEYVLTDQSTNGVFINDSVQPVGRGRSHTLADGDTVTLGPVRLEVSITAAGEVESEVAGPPGAGFDDAFDGPLPASRPVVGGVIGAGAFPFSGVPQSPDSPIAAPPVEPWLQAIPGGEFGPDRHVAAQGWETPLDPADYAASGEQQSRHPLDVAPQAFVQGDEHVPAIATVMKLPTAQSVLPTDWNDTDPMANALLAPSPIEALDQARPGQPPVEPVRGDAIVIPGEDLLAPMEPAVPEVSAPDRMATPALVPDDFGAELVAAPAPAVAASEGVDALVTNVGGLGLAPAILPAPDLAAASAAWPSLPGAAADEAAPGVLEAFLKGAGLTRDAVGGASDEELGRNLGKMVRAAVEGMRDILATRAMVKSELRVSQTVIQATDNSALKFAPDVRRCLAAMVGTPPRGFVPGAAAMVGAMDDIKRHELALVAALNFVFSTMTETLDPEAIATKVRGESGIGNMLPYAREARCWAVYLENYAAFQATGAANTAGSLLAPLAAAYARQLHPIDTPSSLGSPLGSPLGLADPKPRQDA